jgi:hypothetical protein
MCSKPYYYTTYSSGYGLDDSWTESVEHKDAHETGAFIIN